MFTRWRQVACLASFAALVANYFARPATGWVSGPGVAVIVTMWMWSLLAVIFRKDRHSWVWYLMIAGSGCFATAGAINFVWQFCYGAFPFPGPADVFFLLVYPFIGAGLAMFARKNHKNNSRALELAGTSVLTISVIGQAFTLPAIWIPISRLPLPGFSKGLIISYPALDLIVLSIAVAVFLMVRTDEEGPKHSSRNELWLVILGLAGLLISDTIFDYVSVRWNWNQPSWVDIGWFLWFLLWALASLEPGDQGADPKSGC